MFHGEIEPGPEMKQEDEEATRRAGERQGVSSNAVHL